MDKTPMWFDLPSNTTIDHKGTKTVNIHTIGLGMVGAIRIEPGI
jgi:hypothetical protein